MKNNTLLSLIALIVTVIGIMTAVILFMRKKRCELFTKIDASLDEDDEIDDEDIDFDAILEDQEEETNSDEGCCADCAECTENCCEPEQADDKEETNAEG